jgi:hypothetical protein
MVFQNGTSSPESVATFERLSNKRVVERAFTRNSEGETVLSDPNVREEPSLLRTTQEM